MNAKLAVKVQCTECNSWITTTLGVVIQSETEPKAPFWCNRCHEYHVLYIQAHIADKIRWNEK